MSSFSVKRLTKSEGVVHLAKLASWGFASDCVVTFGTRRWNGSTPEARIAALNHTNRSHISIQTEFNR